jgi:ATP-dependent Clp protease ATP-binding subunit ClpA
MTKFYIAYNQHLDTFIKITKYSKKELSALFSDIDKYIKRKDFSYDKFVATVVGFCIPNYEQLKGEYKEHDNIDVILYDSITDVYPMLNVDMACTHFNAGIDVDSTEESEDNIRPLKKKDIIAVERDLKTNIVGQDLAVGKVVDALKLQAAGFEPLTSLFFVGPTGVGKTELAKVLSESFLGAKRKMVKINCAEYSNSHEYAKLIGSPPGYVGSNEKGILAEKAELSSQWVILFDEIEKASHKLHNLLLALLDDGTLTDNRGVELSFKNSIIIFTSNVGLKDTVGKLAVGFGQKPLTYEDSRDEITKAFKNEFSPEFVNRLDHIVHFNSLNEADARKIIKLQLQKIPVKITTPLVNYVLSKAYSREYGARNIKRFIKTDILTKLADKIISTEGRYTTYEVPIIKGELGEFEGIAKLA